LFSHNLWGNIYEEVTIAGVTQLVESLPSKQVVAGSSPVSRSMVCPALAGVTF
jgi:hypothetical protein